MYVCARAHAYVQGSINFRKSETTQNLNARYLRTSNFPNKAQKLRNYEGFRRHAGWHLSFEHPC